MVFGMSRQGNLKENKMPKVRYRGGEFIFNEFNEFCIEKGIKRQVSKPSTP